MRPRPALFVVARLGLLALASCPPAVSERARPIARSPPPKSSAPMAIPSTSAAPAASSAPSPPPAAEVVLYDPESGRGGNAYRSRSFVDAIDRAEAGAVLKMLFPKFVESCWTKDGQEAPNAKGNVAPRVESRTEGAFTAPRVHEILYVIDVNECGAAAMTASRRIVVIRGDAVVATWRGLAPAMGPPVVAPRDAFDLDGDGRLEVLVTQTAFQYGGYAREEARLVHFAAADGDAAMSTVKDFGEVYASNCGSTEAERSERFSVIRTATTSGTPPAFRQSKKTRACR
jgi:hypothetical protein